MAIICLFILSLTTAFKITDLIIISGAIELFQNGFLSLRVHASTHTYTPTHDYMEIKFLVCKIRLGWLMLTDFNYFDIWSCLVWPFCIFGNYFGGKEILAAILHAKEFLEASDRWFEILVHRGCEFCSKPY